MAALQRLKLGNVQSLVKNVLEDRFEEVGGDWLNECLLALSPSGYAAVAKGSKISWKQFGSGLKDVVIKDAFDSQFFEDDVTALAWLEVECTEDREGAARASEGTQQPHNSSTSLQALLAVGCRSGQVKLFNQHGRLLVSQFFELSAVKRLRVRGQGCMDGSQDLLVMYEESTVARVDGSAIFRVLASPERPAQTLDHGKWKLSTQEGMTDAVCCGLDATAEGGDFWGAAYYKLLAGGARPALSVFAVCDERHSSSAKEMVSKLASAAFTIAKSYLWGKPEDHQDKDDASSAASKPPIEPARWVAATDALEDGKRTVRDIVLEPLCRVAAASDTLGRVMVVDVEDFLVLRLFKGYREPQCAWVVERRTEGGQREAAEGGEGRGRGSGGEGRLCLLLLAPRRGLVEAWRLSTGERVGVERIEGRARLLALARPLREYEGADHDAPDLDTEEAGLGSEAGAAGPEESEEKEMAARVRAEADEALPSCVLVHEDFAVSTYRIESSISDVS